MYHTSSVAGRRRRTQVRRKSRPFGLTTYLPYNIRSMPDLVLNGMCYIAINILHYDLKTFEDQSIDAGTPCKQAKIWPINAWDHLLRTAPALLLVSAWSWYVFSALFFLLCLSIFYFSSTIMITSSLQSSR